jgi:hypothetical protein
MMRKMKRTPSAPDLGEGALAEGLLALRQTEVLETTEQAQMQPAMMNGMDEVGNGQGSFEGQDRGDGGEGMNEYYSDSDLMDEGDSGLDDEGDSGLDDEGDGEEDQDEAATLANLTAATKAFGQPTGKKGKHSLAVVNCHMLGFDCVNARNHSEECKLRSKDVLEKNKTDKVEKKAAAREVRLRAKAEKAKKPRGKRGPYKKKDNVGRICIECPCAKVVCKGLCRRCYQKRRKAKESGKPCSTCGRTPSWAKGRCYRCYINVRKGQVGIPRAPRPEPVQVPVEQLEAVVYYQVRARPHVAHGCREGGGEGGRERKRYEELISVPKR